MYLDLARIKKHLNLDLDFEDDDEYILFLAKVAEEVVQKHIDTKLEELATQNGGELPPPLIQAILLYIGNLYLVREAVTVGNISQVPFNYGYLLDLYKDYSNKNS